MGRNLLGFFFLTAGLFALASVAKAGPRFTPDVTPRESGSRLSETGPAVVAVTASPVSLPALTFHARVSIN
jgi:hypothetical protein